MCNFIAFVGKKRFSDLARARHGWRPVWGRSRWNLIGPPVFVAGLPSCRARRIRCHRSKMGPLEMRLLNWRLSLPVHGVPFCNRCPSFVTKGRKFFLIVLEHHRCDSFRCRRCWEIPTASLAIFGGLNISARKFSLWRLLSCRQLSPECPWKFGQFVTVFANFVVFSLLVRVVLGPPSYNELDLKCLLSYPVPCISMCY